MHAGALRDVTGQLLVEEPAGRLVRGTGDQKSFDELIAMRRDGAHALIGRRYQDSAALVRHREEEVNVLFRLFRGVG